MLGHYKSNESAGSSATSALAEIREGAERLAMELDEYLSKSSNSKTSIFRVDGVSSTPIEAVADLQLATARKLREVWFRISNTKHSCGNPFSFKLTCLFSFWLRPVTTILF